MIKSDKWIRCLAIEKKMIDPFAETQVGKGVISFGLSSYGYDMRLTDEFLVCKPKKNSIVDPKNFDRSLLIEEKGPSCLIPPGSFVLGRSIEYFRIPRNILALTFGKSTYARSGVIVNVTPFEPEWEGFVTIAISNTSPHPTRIYANEGIGQVVFFGADEVCQVSYRDKKGKYQKQRKTVLSKV